jgi:hypothetical protein
MRKLAAGVGKRACLSAKNAGTPERKLGSNVTGVKFVVGQKDSLGKTVKVKVISEYEGEFERVNVPI